MPGCQNDHRNFHHVMRIQRPAILLIAVGIVLLIVFLPTGLVLKVEEMRSPACLYQVPVREGDEFTLEFIHSVQRTPVKEVFRIDGKGSIYLIETEYQSFGAGLPTMPDVGAEVEVEGGKIRITGMRRKIDQFLVAVSPVPGHALTVGGEKVELASLAQPGTGLLIRVARERLLVAFVGRRYEWTRKRI